MEAVNKKRQAQDKKNALRRQYRQQAREALFIQDYIHEKYPEAYEEAATFYNYINNIYLEKKDLRRTDEFKALKMGFTFVVKERNNVHKPPAQVFQPITDLSQGNYTIVCHMPSETATETERSATTETE